MRQIHLTIAEPCPKDWNAMTGSEKRRHCAQCDKHVVALSEMTPDEAEALIRESKPHSLCLHIEHDDDGTIHFREGVSSTISNRSRPLVTLVMGASLLAGACERPTEPSATLDPAKTSATESVERTVSAQNDVAVPGDSRNGQLSQVPIANSVLGVKGPAVPGTDEKSVNDTHARPGKMQNATKPRTTTGCVCAVGDRLCDCL